MEPSNPALDLKYPIGRFQFPASITADIRAQSISEIEQLPAALRTAAAHLTGVQLDTPYREGGWTVRQVIHHLADSHMNSFIRFKLALTEDAPVIKPYKEPDWADTADSAQTPVEPSLAILDGLHQRWAALLRGMSADAFDRTFIHPERGQLRLDVALALYAWHGRHHIAHITGLRERSGW